MDDWDLLERYLREGAQDAFAELVSRHVNLVYSAARRQVRSPEVVQEVVQNVFLALARQGGRLERGRPLAPWLYVVTRTTALKAGRTEGRRLAREHAAYELSTMNANESPSWPRLERFVDEAVAALPEADRAAIVLRFFEGRGLREVGAAMGVSEDAAQKRVSRALDQLRASFRNHGVTVTAAALATDLSAHGIEAAPAALSASMAPAVAAAGLAGPAAGIATATVTSKVLSAAAAAVAIGLGSIEAVTFVRAGSHEARLARQATSLEQEIAGLQARPAPPPDEAQVALPDLNLDFSGEVRAWMGRVTELRRHLGANPGWGIPELGLLPDAAWLDVTRTGNFGSEEAARPALVKLRGEAQRKFADLLRPAMREYLAANRNVLPASPAAFASYLKVPNAEAMLARYEMIQTGSVAAPDGSNRFASYVRLAQPADYERDMMIEIGPNSYGGGTTGLKLALERGIQGYRQANGGAEPQAVDQVLPYLPQPVAAEKLRPYWNSRTRGQP